MRDKVIERIWYLSAPGYNNEFKRLNHRNWWLLRLALFCLCRWICFRFCVFERYKKHSNREFFTFHSEKKTKLKNNDSSSVLFMLPCFRLRHTFTHYHSQILLAFSKLCLLEWTLINLWVKFFGSQWISDEKINSAENSRRFCVIVRLMRQKQVERTTIVSAHKNILIHWSLLLFDFACERFPFVITFHCWIYHQAVWFKQQYTCIVTVIVCMIAKNHWLLRCSSTF